MRPTLVSLVVVFAAAQAARSDDAADARALVEKAVKARGDKPGNPAPAMTWKDKGKFTGGGMSADYTGEWAFQGPDRYRFTVNIEIEGAKIVFAVVINGDKAWESALGQTQEMKGEKLEYVVNQTYALHVATLQPLLTDKAFKLATAGEKDVGGKKASVVKVTRDKRPAVTLYFDKATGLLVKSESRVKDEFQGWKEVTDENFYEDYKEAGGKKYFTKLRVVRDGKPMIESTMSDYKTADKLDAKLFEKP